MVYRSYLQLDNRTFKSSAVARNVYPTEARSGSDSMLQSRICKYWGSTCCHAESACFNISRQFFEISTSERASSTLSEPRICDYLGLPCTHNRSFLCLPPAARHHIYCIAGLSTGTVIKFDSRLSKKHQWPHPEDLRQCLNLLLTCRTIHIEVLEVLYSTNAFSINYRHAKNLHALRNLNPKSISLLTHLRVYLNVSSDCRKACCSKQSCHKHDVPLSSSSSRYREILRQWQSAARHLTAYMTPSRLELHFTCDVEDLKAGMGIIDPLLNSPILAACNIRLSQQPYPPLQSLAQYAVAYTTGLGDIRQDGSSFPFLSLPEELRHQILEYTDLVSPLNEIEWTPGIGFHLRYSRLRCGYPDCPPDFHHACRFRNCKDMTTVGCFCRCDHAAFSRDCRCWSPPRALFLVCRSFREDAQAVFFKRNRFVITPVGWVNPPLDKTLSRLPASVFLRDIVPRDALRFLRILEIALPSFDEDYVQLQKSTYEDWLHTIDLVKTSLDLPRLTISVHFAQEGILPFRKTREQCISLCSAYSRVIKPLSRLQGLSRCFVHITWPYPWTLEQRPRPNGTPASTREKALEIEQYFERFIMGGNYDSTVLGKTEAKSCQWQKQIDESLEYWY